MNAPISFGRRLDGPGGRRSTDRKRVSVGVSLFAMHGSRVVMLCDISRTGARLVNFERMRIGEQVWLKVGNRDLFGRVAWIEREHCGIRFDEELDPRSFELLMRALPEYPVKTDGFRH